jgi:parallel beta-helix repeat protein
VSRRVARPAATALAILAVGLAGCGGDDDGSAGQAAQRACDRVAQPGPEAAQGLVDSLEPGEVGCLAEGTYREALTIRNAGAAGKPITLRARPGARATVAGPISLTRTAEHVVIRGLYLDGRNDSGSPSPAVNGRDILFAGNDVTNDHTAICFTVGHPRFGAGRDVTIQGNRIHDCGKLPATNLEQGIYVADATATRIVGNWIYDNADQGIQLYPNSRGSLVAGNVIDGNGEGIIFGGTEGIAANDNLVQGNVISNSKIRNNVEWHFDGPVGRGNVLRRNCIGGGARDDGNGGIMEPEVGFTAEDNVVAEPAFRGPGDYRLKPRSACRRVFSGNPDRVPGPPR